MTWRGEKSRHAMSARGIKSNINLKSKGEYYKEMVDYFKHPDAVKIGMIWQWTILNNEGIPMGSDTGEVIGDLIIDESQEIMKVPVKTQNGNEFIEFDETYGWVSY